MDLMSPGSWRPIDRPTLEVVVPAYFIRCYRLVCEWISEEALLPTQAGPFAADVAMNLMSVGLWCPIDRPALEVIVPSYLIRSYRLIGERIA
jgi:hypothetical protein